MERSEDLYRFTRVNNNNTMIEVSIGLELQLQFPELIVTHGNFSRRC